MKLQLIRNATLKLAYAGRSILVDPYFAPRHSLPSYTGRSANPLVDLPLPVEDILDGIDLVVVSHPHSDHFDGVAKSRLPKDIPILCQPGDEGEIAKAGFCRVMPLVDVIEWQGLHFRRCEASHGLGPVVEVMGKVMGFVLRAGHEPSLYWTGDTVLYPPVLDTMARERPEVIVSHSCGALWDGSLIVMDRDQTLSFLQAALAAGEETVVIATHMDCLDHATVTRADLLEAALQNGIPPHRFRVPQDGEVLLFPSHG